jgi:hypothetical protein
MPGCAVGPDGNPLDTEDIQWYEDVDSSEPINLATTPSSSVTTANTSTAIHPFFHGVATACCSSCMTRPSNRITDPDNAAVTHKRKASRGMAAGCHINHKVAVNDKGSSDGSETSDYKPNVAELPAASSDKDASKTEQDEDTDIGYVSTKAMGDADCEVSVFSYLCRM